MSSTDPYGLFSGYGLDDPSLSPEERRRLSEQLYGGATPISWLPQTVANHGDPVVYQGGHANIADDVNPDHIGIDSNPSADSGNRGTYFSGQYPGDVVKMNSQDVAQWATGEPVAVRDQGLWETDERGNPTGVPTGAGRGSRAPEQKKASDYFGPGKPFGGPAYKRGPEDLDIGQSMVIGTDEAAAEHLGKFEKRQEELDAYSKDYFKELNHWYTPLIAAALPAYASVLYHKGNELSRQHDIARRDYAVEAGRVMSPRNVPEAGLMYITGKDGTQHVIRTAHPRLTRAQEGQRVDDEGNVYRTLWNPETQRFEDAPDVNGQPQMIRRAKAQDAGGVIYMDAPGYPKGFRFEFHKRRDGTIDPMDKGKLIAPPDYEHPKTTTETDDKVFLHINDQVRREAEELLKAQISQGRVPAGTRVKEAYIWNETRKRYAEFRASSYSSGASKKKPAEGKGAPAGEPAAAPPQKVRLVPEPEGNKYLNDQNYAAYKIENGKTYFRTANGTWVPFEGTRDVTKPIPPQGGQPQGTAEMFDFPDKKK